jgi:hypothetical protein
MSANDPRERTMTWLETYDTPANITKDDDITAATIHYQFEYPPYPLKKIFFDPKNVDGLVTIGTPTTEPMYDWKKEGYCYKHQIPIELSAVNKSGITGDKLRWKMEADLQNIAETYPLGSVRTLRRLSPKVTNMGTWKLHTVQYLLDYKVPAEDYTSDVTLSYGGSKTQATGWIMKVIELLGDLKENGKTI